MSKCKGKGSGYERQICKELSLWWTCGKNDAVFWRTSNSGGRAKTRSKQGKATINQYGDINAVDPIGDALTSLFSIELKRGYGTCNIGDICDRLPRSKPQQFESFIEQAATDQQLAGLPYWMLITRRNARLSMVFMPLSFMTDLKAVASRSMSFEFKLTFAGAIKLKSGHYKKVKVVGLRFDEFLAKVDPLHVEAIAEKYDT